MAALHKPERIRCLAPYEPTLFAVIDAESPPNQADGIRNAVAAASSALDNGNRNAAAQAFIDYWMGEGSWAQTPEQRKPSIAASVTNVRRWAHEWKRHTGAAIFSTGAVGSWRTGRRLPCQAAPHDVNPRRAHGRGTEESVPGHYWSNGPRLYSRRSSLSEGKAVHGVIASCLRAFIFPVRPIRRLRRP